MRRCGNVSDVSGTHPTVGSRTFGLVVASELVEIALPGSECAGRTLGMGCLDAVARFDRWAPDYDDSALQNCLYRPVHAVVLDRCELFVPRPRRVLDLGCGTGRLLEDASRRFHDASLVGVDVSQRMLEVVAGERNSVAPVRARAEHLPFADGSFDLVMATFTYRHWREPAAGIVEIGRILSSDGVCALAVVITEPVRVRRGRPWRRRFRLPRSLGTELATAGLRVRSVDHLRGLGPVVDVTVVIAEQRQPGRRPKRSGTVRPG